jgi:hypothetical protein
VFLSVGLYAASVSVARPEAVSDVSCLALLIMEW